MFAAGTPGETPIDLSFNTVALPYLIPAFIMLWIVNIISFGLIFHRFSVPVWKAAIPIYRNMAYLETGNISKWFGLLSITPLLPVYLVMALAATHNISKAMKYDSMMTYVGALCFPIYSLLIFSVPKSVSDPTVKSVTKPSPYFPRQEETPIPQAGSLTTPNSNPNTQGADSAVTASETILGPTEESPAPTSRWRQEQSLDTSMNLYDSSDSSSLPLFPDTDPEELFK